ncbi:hypothetical protein [Hyphomonas sp.]|uniref:hypothetical protein n=1 Tax=Hyphomonas sp. TaxID=87 RepID=UPI0025C42BDD|nr:hypothetical protein [Hyphomonas sp.]
MNRDVTAAAETARRLDVSATLRAFAAPAAILLVTGSFALMGWQAASDPYSGGDWILLIALLGAVSLIASPALAVFVDALARQDMPRASGAVALIAGGLLHAGLAVAVMILLLVGLASAFDPAALDELRYVVESPEFPLQVAALALYAVYGWLLWRTVQVETALSAAPSRALLLGDLGGAGFWPRFGYLLGIPASMWSAGALAAPAFWLFLLARVLVYAAIAPVALAIQVLGDPYDTSGVSLPVLLAIAAALFLSGHLVFLAAKRLAARRIWKEPRSANAGPILFLRSFRDDQFRFEKSWRDPVGRWLELWSFRRNADEMLVDEFAWYGPVIALGQPGESHTPFGADRRYVDHDTWQAVVEDAAARAHTVVVGAGETPGLVWEYELIARRGFFGKTIYLFPPHAASHPASVRAVELFNKAYPDHPITAPAQGVLVAALIEGTAVHTMTARRPTAQAYLVALRRVLQARETVLGRTVGDRPMPVGVIVAVAAGVLAGIVLGVALSEFG